MVANRGPITSGVTLALIIVATLFVAARFYTRTYIVRSIKQDDWWILAAWLCSVGFSVAICMGVSYGLGTHNTDIPDAQKDNLRRAEYTFSILYNPCLMLTKNSIITFYLSVMSKDVDVVFKWCNWITLAIVNIAGIALTFLNIIQCRNPVSAGWSYPTPSTAKCTDIVTLYLSSAPVNIVTDLALLLLPMPILTGLRLPKKQKIILVVTFSAGIFVAVVDVVRIAYLQNAALDRLSVTNTGGDQPARIVESSDFPWYASLSFMWSAIEVSVGIICACVPSLKPLFLKFAPNFIRDASDDVSSVGSVDIAAEKRDEPLSSFNVDKDVLTHPAAFRKATIREYAGDDDGDYMGFLNMLSDGPDDDEGPTGTTRRATHSSRLTRTSTALSKTSDFGFVNMNKNKNMLKLTNKQSLWPVAVVTVIFFLWGFAYGLLDTLNSQFQTIAGLSTGQGLGLHGAYYAGYFIAPLTLGRFILHRYGFKACMIAGLCVYGCGTLVFWPSAVLTSYAAFIISNFIVGAGLSLLEVAANPFIALCGPLEYAEVRLNFSQAFQAVGTIVSPLLATRVLFKDVLNAPSLVNVQWAYLGISLFDFALAIIFYYIRLPEATAEQLEEQADKRSAVYRTRIGGFRVVWITLVLGVFAQWCYVGAQEGNGGSTGGLFNVLGLKSGVDAFDFETVGHTTFAIGRFMGAFLNYLIKPRWLLMACFVGCIVLSAVQMSATGAGGAAVNNLLYFCEGSIFPIVYAISMRGMGDQTFNAAAYMTAAISSGAVIPPIVWAVTNSHGVKYSYSVVLAVFIVGTAFPLYLNFFPAAKRQVDPIHESRNARRKTRRMLRANSVWSEGLQSEITPDQEFGIAGIIARRRKNHAQQKSGVSSTMPTSQHVERPSQSDLISPVSPKNTQGMWETDTNMSTPSPARRKSAGSHITSVSPWHRSEASNSSNEDRNSIQDNEYTQQQSHNHPRNHRDVKVVGRSSDDENMSPVPTQERREWTEEDDIRDDYHKALRGL